MRKSTTKVTADFLQRFLGLFTSDTNSEMLPDGNLDFRLHLKLTATPRNLSIHQVMHPEALIHMLHGEFTFA